MTPCERAQQIMDETDRITPEAHDYGNRRRAARVTLTILPDYDDLDAQTGIKDALTDIMHLCDVAGWDFADLCERGRTNYLFEVEDLGVAEDQQLNNILREN